jgi:hypothetical protein
MKPGNYFHSFFYALIFSAVLFFSGCSDTNTGPVSDNIEIGYRSSPDNSAVDGIFQLDSIKVLVQDIKLGSSMGVYNSFRYGPYILYINLNSTTITRISNTYMGPGAYSSASLDVHQLGVGESVGDPDFVDANGRYSMVAKGTYNGTAFTYKSTASGTLVLNFPSTIDLVANSMTFLTLRVSPYGWFLSGGTYLDPTNTVNDAVINSNIQTNINNSFRIYRDTNRDGEPD